jgi:hypothetical protein
VPQLLLIEGKHVTQEPDTKKKHGRRSRPSSRRSARSARSSAITEGKSPIKSNTNVEGRLSLAENSQEEAGASRSKDGLDLVLSSTSIGGGVGGEKGTDNVLSSVIVEQEEDDMAAMPSMGGEL